MSWAPSNAKPTVSTVLVGGETSSPLLGKEGLSWRGSSRVGPSRRDIISGNHTLSGYHGAMIRSRTRCRRTLSSTPGSRAIGIKAYRRRENQSRQWDVSWDSNRSTWAWPNSLHISSTTSGWSLHSPGLTPCLLLHYGPPGCMLLEETATSLVTTGEFGTPVCKVDVTVNPPGDLCRRPPMCCLSRRAHGGPQDLLGNS